MEPLEYEVSDQQKEHRSFPSHGAIPGGRRAENQARETLSVMVIRTRKSVMIDATEKLQSEVIQGRFVADSGDRCLTRYLILVCTSTEHGNVPCSGLEQRTSSSGGVAIGGAV